MTLSYPQLDEPSSPYGEIKRELEEDGVVLLRGFFAPDLYAGWTQEYLALKGQIGEPGSPLQRFDRFVSGAIPPPLGAIYQDPKFVALMQSLIGPDVALYMNRLMVKDQAWSGPVAPHLDLPYFHGGPEKISVFVPLSRQTPEDGNLYFYRKSHHYGNLGRGGIDVDKFPSLDKFQPDLDVGDIVLMDFCTWHGSDAPTRQTERALLQIAFQSAIDGSFQAGSLAAPTLVSGCWQTTYFSAHNFGITPD